MRKHFLSGAVRSSRIGMTALLVPEGAAQRSGCQAEQWGTAGLQGFPPRLLAISERCPQAMLQREHWSISELALVRQVGCGAASSVYYALCRRTHMPLAVKMYEKSKLSRLNRHQVEREINIHSSLSHPHIVDFYAAFEDDQRLYLLMEFADRGDLFDEVKRHGGRLTEKDAVEGVLAPYLDALSYLHGRGILHRDIKPENTVFSKQGVLKVADFGLAICHEQERPVTRLGTLDYMAPEVLRCPDKQLPGDNKDRADLAYGPAVDAWALGVLAYELLVGRPPFGMSSRDDTMRAICNASPPMPEWLSPQATSFITAALRPSDRLRPSVLQLRQHPWITGTIGRGAATANSAAESQLQSNQAHHRQVQLLSQQVHNGGRMAVSSLGGAGSPQTPHPQVHHHMPAAAQSHAALIAALSMSSGDRTRPATAAGVFGANTLASCPAPQATNPFKHVASASNLQGFAACHGGASTPGHVQILELGGPQQLEQHQQQLRQQYPSQHLGLQTPPSSICSTSFATSSLPSSSLPSNNSTLESSPSAPGGSLTRTPSGPQLCTLNLSNSASFGQQHSLSPGSQPPPLPQQHSLPVAPSAHMLAMANGMNGYLGTPTGAGQSSGLAPTHASRLGSGTVGLNANGSCGSGPGGSTRSVGSGGSGSQCWEEEELAALPPSLAHVLLGRAMQNSDRPAKRSTLGRSMSLHLASNGAAASPFGPGASPGVTGTGALATANSAGACPGSVAAALSIPSSPIATAGRTGGHHNRPLDLAGFHLSASFTSSGINHRMPATLHLGGGGTSGGGGVVKQHAAHHHHGTHHHMGHMGHLADRPRTAAAYWRTDGVGWGSRPDVLAALQTNTNGVDALGGSSSMPNNLMHRVPSLGIMEVDAPMASAGGMDGQGSMGGSSTWGGPPPPCSSTAPLVMYVRSSGEPNGISQPGMQCNVLQLSPDNSHNGALTHAANHAPQQSAPSGMGRMGSGASSGAGAGPAMVTAQRPQGSSRGSSSQQQAGWGYENSSQAAQQQQQRGVTSPLGLMPTLTITQSPSQQQQQPIVSPRYGSQHHIPSRLSPLGTSSSGGASISQQHQQQQHQQLQHQQQHSHGKHQQGRVGTCLPGGVPIGGSDMMAEGDEEGDNRPQRADSPLRSDMFDQSSDDADDDANLAALLRPSSSGGVDQQLTTAAQALRQPHAQQHSQMAAAASMPPPLRLHQGVVGPTGAGAQSQRPASARAFHSIKRRTPDVSLEDVMASLRGYVGTVPWTGAPNMIPLPLDCAADNHNSAGANGVGSRGSSGTAASTDLASSLSSAGLNLVSAAGGSLARTSLPSTRLYSTPGAGGARLRRGGAPTGMLASYVDDEKAGNGGQQCLSVPSSPSGLQRRGLDYDQLVQCNSPQQQQAVATQGQTSPRGSMELAQHQLQQQQQLQQLQRLQQHQQLSHGAGSHGQQQQQHGGMDLSTLLAASGSTGGQGNERVLRLRTSHMSRSSAWAEGIAAGSTGGMQASARSARAMHSGVSEAGTSEASTPGRHPPRPAAAHSRSQSGVLPYTAAALRAEGALALQPMFTMGANTRSLNGSESMRRSHASAAAAAAARNQILAGSAAPPSSPTVNGVGHGHRGHVRQSSIGAGGGMLGTGGHPFSPHNHPTSPCHPASPHHPSFLAPLSAVVTTPSCSWPHHVPGSVGGSTSGGSGSIQGLTGQAGQGQITPYPTRGGMLQPQGSGGAEGPPRGHCRTGSTASQASQLSHGDGHCIAAFDLPLMASLAIVQPSSPLSTRSNGPCNTPASAPSWPPGPGGDNNSAPAYGTNGLWGSSGVDSGSMGFGSGNVEYTPQGVGQDGSGVPSPNICSPTAGLVAPQGQGVLMSAVGGSSGGSGGGFWSGGMMQQQSQQPSAWASLTQHMAAAMAGLSNNSATTGWR